MNTDISNVSGEQWAQRIKKLPAATRRKLMKAADALLAQPGNISDPLESELYVLSDQLRLTAADLWSYRHP